MKKIISILTISSIFLFFMYTYAFASQKTTLDNIPDKSKIKIAVMSDIHYYSPDLFTNGKPLNEYLANDRKLLAQSDAILKKAIEEIKKSDADIVLIPGDLTKDGEMIDHQVVSFMLEELKSSGKKVYVIDGNHDINNPEAVIMTPSSTVKIRNTSVDDFKKIYNDFGYSEAIAKDPNSLSYVVEPFKNFRILAMDSCIYDNNSSQSKPTTGGEFTQKRLNWIKAQLQDAKAKGITIIGMMHHGIIQHFDYEEQFFSDYLIKDWRNTADLFADSGMNVVFTGHFHAQDIVQRKTAKGNTLFDVETGSLVTYPSPYRFIELTNDGKMAISSHYITSIDYDTGNSSFQDYSKQFLMDNLKQLVPKALISKLVQNGVSKKDAQNLVNRILKYQIQPKETIEDMLYNLMAAYYQGDETISKTTRDKLTAAAKNTKDFYTKFFIDILLDISTDLPPADNNVTVNLLTGETIK